MKFVVKLSTVELDHINKTLDILYDIKAMKPHAEFDDDLIKAIEVLEQLWQDSK